MLTNKDSSGQLISAEAKACTLSINNTDSVWFTDPPDFKITLSEAVAVNAPFLHQHAGDQTLQAQLNFGFTDSSVSKRQLVLSLLTPFPCIGARRHRVWSRVFIHAGSCFLSEETF